MKQYQIGCRETLTGEQLLERYAAGERDFILSSITDSHVLEGANLSGINLMGSNLDGPWERCNLSYSCLIGCKITFAPGTDFSYANMTGINMNSGQMMGVNLTRAIIENASLSSTDFSDAIIKETSFDGSWLRETIFLNSKEFFIHDRMTKVFLWEVTMPDGSVVKGPRICC